MSDKKEILIVDDDEANVIFFAQVLEDSGYGFRVARNGKEAIAALEQQKPDLVLLDLMMPRKSGIHVYNAMKKDDALARIPIVVVTGMTDATGVDVRTGAQTEKESYADDLIRKLGSTLFEQLKGLAPNALLEKPVEPELLSQTVKELLA
jgi:twitching motility two-component system response regulator PilH